MLEQASRSAAEAVRQEFAQQQQQPQQQSQPQPEQQDMSIWDQLEEEYAVDGKTMKFIGQNIEQRFQGFSQAAQQLYNQNLSMLEALSRQSEPQMWEKYGDEIREIIDRRKEQKVIERSDYDEAINIVKANHLDEIADELVEQRMAGMPTSERAGDAGFASEGAAPEYEIPEAYKKLFERRGITETQIREHCRKMGISLEQYVKMMQNGQVIMEGDTITRSYDLIPEDS